MSSSQVELGETIDNIKNETGQHTEIISIKEGENLGEKLNFKYYEYYKKNLPEEIKNDMNDFYNNIEKWEIFEADNIDIIDNINDFFVNIKYSMHKKIVSLIDMLKKIHTITSDFLNVLENYQDIVFNGFISISFFAIIIGLSYYYIIKPLHNKFIVNDFMDVSNYYSDIVYNKSLFNNYFLV